MDRRRVMEAIGALALWPLGLLAEDSPRPRHRISAGQLHKMLSARFPVRFGIAGLIELQVSAPRLLLLPSRNRLGAALLAQVGGVQAAQVPPGELDLVFALRYEAADRTVRAHDPQVLDVRWPGLPPDAIEVVQGMVPALAAQVGEVVLHRFSQGELALPDTMGFEPEELKVHDDGLEVIFGARSQR